MNWLFYYFNYYIQSCPFCYCPSLSVHKYPDTIGRWGEDSGRQQRHWPMLDKLMGTALRETHTHTHTTLVSNSVFFICQHHTLIPKICHYYHQTHSWLHLVTVYSTHTHTHIKLTLVHTHTQPRSTNTRAQTRRTLPSCYSRPLLVQYWPALALAHTHSLQAAEPFKEDPFERVYIHWSHSGETTGMTEKTELICWCLCLWF